MRALTLAAVAVAGAAAAGALYQSLGSRRDRRRFPHPGRLIDVGGHRLHVFCRAGPVDPAGFAGPTVILESAIAASSLSWSRVQPAVAACTRVCAYDRAGLGWSDAPPEPQTLARVLDDLHALIATLDCAVPCVLVGHSFGAFVCLAYAAAHPTEVAGLVLVDPPSEWTRMDPQQDYLLRGAMAMSRLGGWLARVGVVRACLALLAGGAPGAPRRFVKVFGPATARTLERLVGEVRKLPPEVHPLVQAAWCQPKCFRAMADHLRVFQEAAVSADRCRPPRAVPITVISSGEQPDDVMAAHEAIAGGSSRGRHIVAAKSGHWIVFDEPELVVDAIRQMIDASRPDRSNPSC